MKLIHGPRASGKTTKAVEIANEEDAYLAVHSRDEASRVYHNYDLDRFPITYQELLNGSEGQRPPRVVIDNLAMFAAEVTLPFEPVAATMTPEGVEKL